MHICQLTGVGGFGRVYHARWRGQEVAVKVLACDDAKHYQVGFREQNDDAKLDIKIKEDKKEKEKRVSNDDAKHYQMGFRE